jgi:CRP/FNR family cyclic AMP-dependent transcriptional regulator
MGSEVSLPDERIFRHSFYKAGTIIFKQNEKGDDIFILKKGAVTVSVDGQMVGLIDTPNTIIGEMAYILNIPRTATIEAVDDCEFVVIPADYLYENVTKNPSIGIDLIQILSKRLANTTKYATKLEKEIIETRGELRKLKGLSREEKPSIEDDMVRRGYISKDTLNVCREEYKDEKAKNGTYSFLHSLIDKGCLSIDQLIEYLEMRQLT